MPRFPCFFIENPVSACGFSCVDRLEQHAHDRKADCHAENGACGEEKVALRGRHIARKDVVDGVVQAAAGYHRDGRRHLQYDRRHAQPPRHQRRDKAAEHGGDHVGGKVPGKAVHEQIHRPGQACVDGDGEHICPADAEHDGKPDAADYACNDLTHPSTPSATTVDSRKPPAMVAAMSSDSIKRNRPVMLSPSSISRIA